MSFEMPVKIRVAIYIRVSSEEQASEGYSLAAQEKVLRDYCNIKGYEIYRVFADEGISGKDIIHRPDMIRLLQDARNRKFNVVLVWKLNRFSRSLKDLLNTCDELESLDIYLESYTEHFDGRTPTGRLMRGVLGLMAQFEREVLSENVKLGQNERANRGHRTCSVVLGYDVVLNGGMVINKKEAKIVRYIFESYREQQSFTEVMRLCAQKGYTGKKGRPLNQQSILVILTRFTYCGYYNWHGKPIKGDFEPIIDIAMFNEIQALIKAQGELNGRRRKNELVFLPYAA